MQFSDTSNMSVTDLNKSSNLLWLLAIKEQNYQTLVAHNW